MNLCRRPLFPFAVAFIAGIICATSMVSRVVTPCTVVLTIAFVGYFLCLRNSSRLFLLLLVSVFVAGVLRVITYQQVSPNDVSRFAEGKSVLITGRIASDPEAFGDRIRFVLACEGIGTYERQCIVSGNAMTTLFLSDDARYKIPCYGEVVRVRGRLRIPHFSTNPGSFDYKAYLARKRIYCTLVGGIDDLSVLSGPRRNLVWVATKARSLLESRTLALFPPLEGKLILGILLGNYALLPPETQAAFMKSGTMHLLAASGFNCGIIVGIFGYLMYKLTTPRTVRHLLLIALLWMFAIMVGAGPSIVRATVMVSAFLAAYLLWRFPDLPNLVLFAALVILGINPLALFDVGFQLSFTAVLAIMLVMPLVNPWIQTFFSPLIATSQTALNPHRWILSASRCIATAVALSVASTIGTWPITAHYFNYVSVVAVFANAITALLVVLLTGVGLATLAASVLSPVIAYPFSLVGKMLADLMLAVVMDLGSHSWSCISVRSPSWAFMFLYYALVLWVLTHVSKNDSAIKGTTDAATAKY